MFVITFLKIFTCIIELYKCSTNEAVKFVSDDWISSKEVTLDFSQVIAENRKYPKYHGQCPTGPTRKIHGGTEANIADVPYQISLRLKSFLDWLNFCGGSLITKKHVLTAMHCFVGENAMQWHRVRVVAGTIRTDSNIFNSGNEHWRRIHYFWKHKKYDGDMFWHDIAILEVEREFVISSSLQPIRMHTSDLNIELEENMRCLISGFGLTEYNKYPSKLRMTCVPIISYKVCKMFYSFGYVHEHIFCAGTYGKDSCQGDSGGPIVCQGVLAGVVSFGGTCGASPGVYTKIVKYTTDSQDAFISSTNHIQLYSMYLYIMFTLHIIRILNK